MITAVQNDICIYQTTQLNPSELESILTLWNEEYPKEVNHDSMESLRNYLNSLTDTKHYILTDNTQLLGWYFDYLHQGERWFSMILEYSIHRKGFGTSLLNCAKTSNNSLKGWLVNSPKYKKSDGLYYHSPIDFYRENGFQKYKKNVQTINGMEAVEIFWKR